MTITQEYADIDLDLDDRIVVPETKAGSTTYASNNATGRLEVARSFYKGSPDGDYTITIDSCPDHSNARIVSSDPLEMIPGVDDEAASSAMWDVWYHNRAGVHLTLAMYYSMGYEPSVAKGRKRCRVCRWQEHQNPSRAEFDEDPQLLEWLRPGRPYECLDTYLYAKAYGDGLTLDQIGERYGQAKHYIRQRLLWDGVTMGNRGRRPAA